MSIAITDTLVPAQIPLNTTDPQNRFTITVKKITCDSSYVTGGYAVTAAQLGLSSVISSWGNVQTPSAPSSNLVTGCTPIVQADGSVLLKLNSAAGAEVASTSNVATTVCVVTSIGLR